MKYVLVFSDFIIAQRYVSQHTNIIFSNQP